MKIDGTPTVEEVCAMMEQLQSWERKEVAERFVSLSDFCDGYSAEAIESATGYYVYEDNPEEIDLQDEDTYDLIIELMRRQEQEEILDHMDINDVIEYVEDKGYTVTEE